MIIGLFLSGKSTQTAHILLACNLDFSFRDRSPKAELEGSSHVLNDDMSFLMRIYSQLFTNGSTLNYVEDDQKAPVSLKIGC